MSIFISDEDLVILTGRKNRKLQIAALKQMGLPFWVNPIGKPIVTVAAVEGRKEPPPKKTWVMPK